MANSERIRGNDIGPTGRTVGENIARIRKSQQISLQALEERLGSLGRRISLSGLSKIENGDRRVDTDDLVALAIALDVSPLGILLPLDEPGAIADVTGATGSVGLFWDWGMAASTPFSRDSRAFLARSVPWWLTPGIDLEWFGDLELAMGIGTETPRPVSRVEYRARTRADVEWDRPAPTADSGTRASAPMYVKVDFSKLPAPDDREAHHGVDQATS